MQTSQLLRCRTFLAVGASALFIHLSGTAASAAAMVFTISANGIKEVSNLGVPNQGDPDGFATGTLTLDNGTGLGLTGSATISLTLGNLDIGTVDLTGNHIHEAAVTTTGPIRLDFGDPDTIRSGSTLSGTITNLDATRITAVFANPTGFYYNLHNAQFPGGAVRDQLVPEPSSIALLGMSVLPLAWRRRSRA